MAVVAGDADHLLVTGPAQIGAGVEFALTVALADTWDNPLTMSGGVAVSIPDGCDGPAEVTVPPSTIEGYTCTLSGEVTFDLQHDVYTGGHDLTVVPGAASELRWLVYPLAGTVAEPLRRFGLPVGAEVTDAYGNRISSTVPITAAIAYNDGRGRLTGTTTVAASGGLASFDTITIDRPGRYTLVASAAGLTPTPAAATFEVTHVAPTFGTPEVDIAGGCATVSVAIAQTLGAPVDVSLAFRWLDPVTGDPIWVPASVGRSSPSGLQGLATTPAGLVHDLVWDASADVPRDGLKDQYDELALEITARAGKAFSSITVPIGYDPRPLSMSTDVPDPANTLWAKVPPVLADFDGDGELDLARWTSDDGALVGFVHDVGGARVADTMTLSSASDVRHFGVANLWDGSYDELWFIPTDAARVHVQPYRRAGPYDVAIADGASQHDVCSEQGGAGVNDVAVADFDGDGDDELAIACQGSSFVQILDTHPDDQDAWIELAFEPNAVVVVDWDRDGKPDLAAAGGDRVSAIIQREQGFVEVDNVSTGAGGIRDLAAFDGDPSEILTPRDGIEDLAIVDGSTNVGWLPSRPIYESGVLVDVFDEDDMRVLDAPHAIDRIAAADLDADGRTDLVGLLEDGGRMVVFRSIRGDTPFLIDTLQAPLGAQDGIALGDVDHDGRPEVAVGTDAFAAVVDFGLPSMCRPDTRGREPDANPGSFLPVTVGARAWADLDRDGTPDQLVVSTNVDDVTTVGWAKGDGRGLLGPFVDLAPALNQAPVVGDFDGDGFVDLAWADPAGLYAVLGPDFGNQVTLVPDATCFDPASPGTLLVSDLDGDGRDDLVAVSETAVTWCANRGDLSFDEPVEIARWDQYTTFGVPEVALRDLNFDGRYDVTANLPISGAYAVCWWVSDGDTWSTLALDCFEVESVPDLSIALDAYVAAGRPAVLVMEPDIEKNQTFTTFKELPWGLPTTDVALPGLHALASTFLLTHHDVTEPKSYVLARELGSQTYRLLFDVDASPAYGFVDQPALDRLELYAPVVRDVDGDGVGDLVDPDHHYSGRALSPAGTLPAFETGVPLPPDPSSLFNSSQYVGDLDLNGYIDNASYSVPTNFGEPQGPTYARWVVTWTDTPGELRQTVHNLEEPTTSFGFELPIARAARMPMPGLVVAHLKAMYVHTPTPDGVAFNYTKHDFARSISAFDVADLDGDGLDDALIGLGPNLELAYSQVVVKHQRDAGDFSWTISGPQFQAILPAALATGHLMEAESSYLPRHVAVAVIDDGQLVIQLMRVGRNMSSLELGPSILLSWDDFPAGIYGLWVADLDGDRQDDIIVGKAENGEGWTFTRGVQFFLQSATGEFDPAGGIDFDATWGEVVLGFADLDRDGPLELVTDLHTRWGRHKPGLIDFGPPSADHVAPRILGEWPWRGRPALVAHDRWLPIPDGAGPPGYGP